MRESQVSRESRSSIFRLGLEMIVPGPVCTNLEGRSDIPSTSHSKDLSVLERANSIVVTVPDKTCIRTDFKLGSTQPCTRTWTRTWTRRSARTWARRIASPLRKQRRRSKRTGEQNQKNEKSDSHSIDHLHLGLDHFRLAIQETYLELLPPENY